jgi:hypothetical protein
MAGFLKPRFSIRTLLVVTAFIACGITIWQLQRVVGPLKAEVKRLRDEVGVLNIEDETKVHAIQVRTNDELRWKWRLWIPPGRKYVLRTAGGMVPKTGFPSEGGTISIYNEGEMWVEFKIMRDPKSGTWEGSMVTSTGSVGGGEQKWVAWGRRMGSGEGVGTTTQVSEPDEVLVLGRHYHSQTAKDSTKIEDPASGFIIWLEPK